MSLPLVHSEPLDETIESRKAAESSIRKMGDTGEFTVSTLLTKNTDNHRDRLSHLLSVMPAGVLVIDHKGRISLANTQAESLFEQPLVGLMWRELIVQAFAPRADDGHEVSMRNGKRVKIQISALTQEKGQLVVITDLTETRQLQNRLSHMEKLSSLGKMMASLAHQVRTPLSSALLYAENLSSICNEGELTDKFSSKLLDRLRELESQVNDMLLFAKKDNNQVVSKTTITQLNSILREKATDLCAQNNVIFKTTFEDSNQTLMLNAPSLKGAVNNLICNAIQACKKAGQPTLEVSTQSKAINDKNYIEIKVIDNGIGIDENEMAKLFEPFYTKKPQGTGLGLAVVSAVTKSHQGHVACGNNQGEGAWFGLYLPLINETTKASGV